MDLRRLDLDFAFAHGTTLIFLQPQAQTVFVVPVRAPELHDFVPTLVIHVAYWAAKGFGLGRSKKIRFESIVDVFHRIFPNDYRQFLNILFGHADRPIPSLGQSRLQAIGQTIQQILFFRPKKITSMRDAPIIKGIILPRVAFSCANPGIPPPPGRIISIKLGMPPAIPCMPPATL